ncbi:MAG TPA: hypothetical protein VFS44_13365 [Gemmatimonadaceae bacterium]|nr:hypothetical protein [Gemmatimonadaceae bacterium]
MTRYALVLLFAFAAPLAAQGNENADIPQTHRPPPGMCRIWIDGVPPARQPAPTDCATAIRRRPPNARVVFGAELRATRGFREERKAPDPPPPEPQPTERRDVDTRPQEEHPRPSKPQEREHGKRKDGKPGRPMAELPPPRSGAPDRPVAMRA